MKKIIRILSLALSVILIVLAFSACFGGPTVDPGYGDGTGQLPPGGNGGGNGGNGGNSGGSSGGNDSGDVGGEGGGSQEEELPEGAIVSGDYVFLDVSSFSSQKRYKIYKYTGSDEQITVPSEFEDGKIYEIKEGAFASATNVKSISLPFAGTSLFDNTASIVAIFGDTLPATLESVEIRGSSIKDGSFSGCENITTLSLVSNVVVNNTDELKKLTSLKKIYVSESAMPAERMYIFKDANNFPHLEFTEQDGGYYIGTQENPYIFLMNINPDETGHFSIKKETKSVTDGVLGTEGLKSVYIPGEVAYVDSFTGKNLIFYLGLSESDYSRKSNWDKWSIDISSDAIYYDVAASDRIIAIDGIEYLVCESNAIAIRVISGERVSIASSVQYADNEYAVTEIADYFAAYSSITDIDIPQTVTKIGESALATPTLDRVFVPASVNAPNYSFSHANTVVYCEAAEIDYSKYYGFDAYYGISKADVHIYGGYDYIIKDGVALLTRAEDNVTKFTVNETVELDGVTYSLRLGVGALSGLRDLVEIHFNCVEIPEIFRKFDSTDVVAPNLRFTYLGENTTTFKAFSDYDGYCFVYVAGTVDPTTIRLTGSKLNLFFSANITESDFDPNKMYYFAGNIYPNSSKPEIVERDGLSYLLYNGKAIVIDAVGLEEIIFPLSIDHGGVTYSVEEIGNYAFCNNTELKSIDLSGCKIVRKHAFDGCVSMTRLFVPSSVDVFDCDFAGKTFFELNEEQASKKDYTTNKRSYFGVTKNDIFVDGDFEYIITSGEASIIDCLNPALESITVPETVAFGGNTYTVTKILSPGFSNCTNIKSLTLTNNIKYVSKDAIKSIKDEALNYYKLNSTIDYGYYLGTADNPYYLYVKPTKYDATDYFVLSDTKIMLYGAFSGCTNIKYVSLEFPGSSASFPTDTRVNYAFGGYIPLSLQKIHCGGKIWYSNTFEGCTNVLYILSSSKLEIIESGALSLCTSLKYETYKGASYLSGNDYRILYSAPRGATEIHNNTRVIYDNAFYGRTDITEIYLPSNVVSIGYNAFYYCKSLTAVYLNSGLKHIGAEAFSRTAISTISLPSSLESLGDGVFYDCASLKELTIPASVTSVGNNLCRDSGVKTIYCLALSKPEGWSDSWSNNFEVIWGPYGVGYQTIGGIEYVVISDTEVAVRSLKQSLTDITIPATVTLQSGKTYNVTKIRYNAFLENTSLRSIKLPTSITSIGSNAFYGCASLEVIYLHNGITEIGTGAFAGCSSLVAYAEAAGRPSGWSTSWSDSSLPIYWSLSESNLILGYAADFVLINGSFTLTRYHGAGATFEISSTAVIENQTFNVTEIGARAFMGYESLKSLYIPSVVKKTGKDAFRDCMNLVIYLEGTSLGGVIYDVNPSGCPVYENVNSTNFATVGEYQYILFDTYAVLTKHIGTSSTCTIEPEIEVDGVTYYVKKIGAMAFSNPDYLTKLIINADLEQIEADAFRNCAFLEHAEIENIVDMYYYDSTGKKVSFTSMEWLFAAPEKVAEAFQVASNYTIHFFKG